MSYRKENRFICRVCGKIWGDGKKVVLEGCETKDHACTIGDMIWANTGYPTKEEELAEDERIFPKNLEMSN